MFILSHGKITSFTVRDPWRNAAILNRLYRSFAYHEFSWVNKTDIMDIIGIQYRQRSYLNNFSNRSVIKSSELIMICSCLVFQIPSQFFSFIFSFSKRSLPLHCWHPLPGFKCSEQKMYLPHVLPRTIL